MISTAIYFVIKLLLVIMLMVGMVVVLFGIGHLYRHEGQNEGSVKELRDEVKKDDRILTRNNLFSKFLLRIIK